MIRTYIFLYSISKLQCQFKIYLLYIDCDDVGVAYEQKHSGEQTPLSSSLPGKSVGRLHNGQNYKVWF